MELADKVYSAYLSCDEDDENFETKNANVVVSKCFKAFKVINEALSELFNQLEDANDAYYRSLSYYKNNGGAYPKYDAVKSIKIDIERLKTVKEFISLTLDEIRESHPWKYTQSFDAMLDEILA